MIRSNKLHSAREYSSIDVTYEGIEISFNDKHPLKTFDSKDAIEEGSSNATGFNNMHPLKTSQSIEDIEEGIVIRRKVENQMKSMKKELQIQLQLEKNNLRKLFHKLQKQKKELLLFSMICNVEKRFHKFLLLMMELLFQSTMNPRTSIHQLRLLKMEM